MTKPCYWLAVPLLLLCLAFDPPTDDTPPIDHQMLLGHLLESEAASLSTDPQTAGEGYETDAPDALFGADPYRIRHLPRTDRYLILLRNASQVVLCDSDLRVIDRAPAPRHPTAVDVVGDDLVFVAGERSGTIGRYRLASNRIQALPGIELPDAVSIRDLVYVREAGSLFLIDGYARRLVQVVLPSDGNAEPADGFTQRAFPIGAGPLRILAVQDHLILDLMLEHALQIVPLQNGTPDFSQATRIVNAGPFWSVDARVVGETLVIAAGGVENRPFSRARGEFGYLDSFLYLFTVKKDQNGVFRWHAGDHKDARRCRSINLSERGVVTPKALAFLGTGQSPLKLWVTGYGADRAIEYTLGSDRVTIDREFRVMPGISDVAVASSPPGTSLVYTNPLFDRVIKVDGRSGARLAEWRPQGIDSPGRLVPRHLGEILFFTELMSPDNSSSAELSRFTCEACHFEGLIDGRVHFTGRDAIHATTKPVRGLANNVPLFSRGGDASLSSMVMAEFLVANQQRKGVFSIGKGRYPWMSWVDGWPETLTPLDLREGLLSFFTAFKPQPNPWRIRYPRLDQSARRGLVVFGDRCADCHQPIRSTRTQEGVHFEDWARWLTDEQRDLVWGAPFFSRTGIIPYVDPAGARVPSLRRVWMKYPLFTNGSAKTIRELLEGFRYQGATSYHHIDDGKSATRTGLKSLTPGQIDDLEMLLRYF